MDHKKHEVWALCILIPTLLVFVSLISFHSSDLTFFNASTMHRPAQNWVGFVGANIAWVLLFLLGAEAYALPLFGLWLSWTLFRGSYPLRHKRVQIPGILFLCLSGVGLASLSHPEVHLFGQPALLGGQIGLIIASLVTRPLHMVGAYILLIGLFLIGLLLATPFSLGACWAGLMRFVAALGQRLRDGVERCRHRVQQHDREFLPQQLVPLLKRITHTEAEPQSLEVLPAPDGPAQDSSSAPSVPAAVPAVQVAPAPPSFKPAVRQKVSSAQAPPAGNPGHYTIPPLDLLDIYATQNHQVNWKKLQKNARILEEKLADFGVQGKVSAISPGPVITIYEYSPAPGIKISRIVNLTDDLSMALKAISIRVVAPIPGKAAIGIELPNENRELVPIHSILEAHAFASSKLPLTIALGKDTTGQPVVTSLARMPHLLIAGATGTGKSMSINILLSSLLYHNTPDDMRLLLIDPKRIELRSYEGIPHLLHPVVTDAKMATRALRWAVQEMELRYQLLADKNVRNIESYNRTLAREKSKPPQSEAEPDDASQLQHHHLPYVVIIIDELADLMMVASREVEESITRLAQMARAAGMHLVLATQRPSVDVLTGIIKANIPTRISFQVSSRIDSRTILDGMGAESLLGDGDMLFLPPGTAKLQRIHGAFISEAEVENLTAFWRSQQLAEDPLAQRVNFQEQSSAEGVAEEELDEKYEDAVQLVMETRQASISMLQRRLRVGYNRAARMIEIMEQQGIVGPSDGVKPREVLTGNH